MFYYTHATNVRKTFENEKKTFSNFNKKSEIF